MTDICQNPRRVAQAISKHFKSVYDNTDSEFPSIPTSFDLSSLENLSLFPVTHADVLKAVNQHKPTKLLELVVIQALLLKAVLLFLESYF
jgi:hypothetical protein